MRDYSKVSGQFWTGKTGKSLRGDPDAQLLALYLMTSPHSNMIGVFHCPILYMAHETGMPFEGASKALRRLIEADFCVFDEDAEVVWVKEMAAHQIGERLSPRDKQCSGIKKLYAQITQTKIRQGFYARYAVDFNLADVVETTTKNTSPFEAPSKPLRSQEQEQEQEQEQKKSTSLVVVASDAPPQASPKKVVKGCRLPDDWQLPKSWGDWAVADKGFSADQVRAEAEKFADHWHAKSGRDAVRRDWLATWRNWIRNAAEWGTASNRGTQQASASIFAGAI